MNSTVVGKINQIAESIYYKITHPSQFKSLGLGLYSGEFGVLLFLFYYARFSQKPQFISLAETYAEELVSRLENELDTHTYCSGLSGILYLFDNIAPVVPSIAVFWYRNLSY